MKQILFLLVIGAAFCFSCNNTTTTTTTTYDSVSTVTTTVDPKHDLFILDSLLKQHETPMQHYKASYAHPMQIKGAKGTIISVNPDDLTTVSGKPFSASIDIELKELTTTEELMRDRAATLSDGRLLVSGGAYYINMSCAGEEVKLKPGKSLAVKFPRITNKDMSFFYGQKDSLGQMNWKPAGPVADSGKKDVTQSDGDVEYREGYDEPIKRSKEDVAAASKLYNEMSLQQFGWINCDYFLRSKVDNLSTLSVAATPTDSLNDISTYVGFREINSLMHGYIFNPAGSSVFRNIPVGSKVTLIAVGIRNGKTYTYRSSFAITPDQKVSIKLKEIPDSAINGLFKLN